KARRHDADDFKVLVVQLYFVSDELRVAAKVTLPEVVSDHGNVVAAGLFVFTRDDAADERIDIQGLEEITGGTSALNSDGAGYAGRFEAGVGSSLVDCERRKYVFSFFPVLDIFVCNAKFPASRLWERVPHRHDSLRLCVSERAQQHRIHKAEDGGV